MSPVYSRGGAPQPTGGQSVTLMSVAEDLLATLIGVADSRAVELPDRRLVYPQVVPGDCPQVSVTIVGYVPAESFDGFTNCQRFRWAGAFVVQIMRNAPAVPMTTSAPPVAKMYEAAAVASQDAEVLLGMLQELDEINGETQIAVGAPEGGLQSTQVAVVLPMPDFR